MSYRVRCAHAVTRRPRGRVDEGMGECSVSRDKPHNTSVPNALAARPGAGIFTARLRSAWHALERRVAGFRVVVGAACDSAVVVSIGRRPAPRCGGMAQGKKGWRAMSCLPVRCKVRLDPAALVLLGWFIRLT